MRQIIFYSITLACLFCSITQGAVFERDWKTPGDGLLTYDDVSGREWLDLTETALTTFSGNDLETRFQSVVAETAPAGMFEGFRVTTSIEELVALAQSSGIDVSTTSPAEINLAATSKLVALLGETSSFENEEDFLTVGFIDAFLSTPDTPLSRAGVAFFHFSVPQQPIRGGVSGLRTGTDLTSGVFTGEAGVFLYRQTIPEPSAFLLMASCLICFSLLARQQCRNLSI